MLVYQRVYVFFGGGLEDVEMMNGIGFEQPNHSTSFGIGASGPGTTHSTRERGNMWFTLR